MQYVTKTKSVISSITFKPLNGIGFIPLIPFRYNRVHFVRLKSSAWKSYVSNVELSLNQSRYYTKILELLEFIFDERSESIF